MQPAGGPHTEQRKRNGAKEEQQGDGDRGAEVDGQPEGYGMQGWVGGPVGEPPVAEGGGDLHGGEDEEQQRRHGDTAERAEI